MKLFTLFLFVLTLPLRADEPDPQKVELFEKNVRPILSEHCTKCHGSEKQESDLRLDTVAGLREGGDRGELFVSEDADFSLLIQAMRYEDDDLQMPPDGKLDPSIIEKVAQWIEEGAVLPDDPSNELASKSNEDDPSVETTSPMSAFLRPVSPPHIPEVKNASWPLKSVDRFILAKLDKAGLRPAAPTDKRTWIRRVTFDLIGLPVESADVDHFLADDSPEAFERVVDRLLQTPYFAERWGRHWLDLVRYAETRGHEFDYVIPNAFQYRDYVIRAIHNDLPYDQFIKEHIAGDLIDPPRLNQESGYNESILGTGFWFLGEEVHSPVDIRKDETDRIDNRIDMMTKAFVGLTVACARCHDHKFDPIPTRDYYSLAGFLVSSSYRQVRFESLEHNKSIARDLDSLRRLYSQKLTQRITAKLRTQLDSVVPLVDTALSHLTVPRDRAEVELALAAARLNLNEAQLLQWDIALRAAVEDQTSPLHSVVTLIKSAPAAKKSPRRNVTSSPSDYRTILDYSDPARRFWFSDGPGFGTGPTRVGAFQFPADDVVVDVPRLSIRSRARRDRLWDKLRNSAGTERDPAKVNWLQSGRMLRTPTIEIQQGRLFYLVRGSGYAYASIDSHRLVNGPLHGVSVRQWKSDNSLRWIEHNLSNYVGHRVHVEFSPRDDVKDGESSNLEILMVVECQKPPALPEKMHASIAVSTRDLSTRSLAGQVVGAVKRMALNFSLSESSLDYLNASDGSTQSQDLLLMNWVLSKPELFGISAGTPGVAELLAEFSDKQRTLSRRVMVESQTAPAMLDANGIDEYLLIRGNPRTPDKPAHRRFLTVIAGEDQPEISSGSGRMTLAQRLVDRSNPLLSRVIVNRIWHHLFGRGIVASVDNFGKLGTPPTHPDLLDHLADQFMDNGWSLKKMIRELCLSQTYRMTSVLDPKMAELDPDNRLFHRMAVKRLQGEAIRDSILAVSGGLKESHFGPSVEIHLTQFMQGRGRPSSGPLDGNGRRSIYLRVRRNFLSPMFLAFDYPIPFTTIGRRTVSNVPAQALMLLNSPLVKQQTEIWAKRVLGLDGLGVEQRIEQIYLTGLGRPPTSNELKNALAFVKQQALQYSTDDDDVRVWTDLCHVIVNVKEFIFIN